MNGTYLDAADEAARELILPEMRRCWGGEMSTESYRNYLNEVDNHPWARRCVRTLVLRDERDDLLSSLALHAVPALHHGKKVMLAGIARVLTPEPLRGRGYAGEMLRATLQLLEQEGVDGAYLYSDITPHFYEAFGFETVSQSTSSAFLMNLPDRSSENETRPLRAEDWQAVWQIYADAGSSEALWFTREPEHWDYLLSRSLAYGRFDPGTDTKPLDLVLLEGGEIVAYLIARSTGNEIQLLELAMPQPNEKRFDSLLAAIRAEGEERGCESVTAPWPPGKWRDLFDSRLDRSDRTEGIFMLASLSGKIDLPDVRETCGGSWDTDRI